MADDMEVDIPAVSMPGGSAFDDVTELFVAAAQEMEPESVILTDEFTLMDAMSAFEIGEPRMDSGMILEAHTKRPFDPLELMLPEEICWLLDRSFACEMEWHAGSPLSQTVYTFLYVHHIQDMNPEFHTFAPTSRDPLRPRELITLVLRAAVSGLVKTCDLSWRELNKGRVFDTEDWQSEKSEISLLEGVNIDFIIDQLDDAADWLRRSALSISHIDALSDRLLLRKILLQLLKLDPTKDPETMRRTSDAGLQLLRRIKSQPAAIISSESKAPFAFDPYITRRLHNFMPTRSAELPPQNITWDAIEDLFHGWAELSTLVKAPNLWTWKSAGSLHVWSPDRQLQKALVRSLTQSAIVERSQIFGRYATDWLVDRFFIETVGLQYREITEAFTQIQDENGAPSLREPERQIIKLVMAHLRSSWFNPPRRRRYLMKSTLSWQELYHILEQLASWLDKSDSQAARVANCIPVAATMWRLTSAREVILSGFQQELYSKEERPIAYWYLAHVLDVHLTCIDGVLVHVRPDNEAYATLVFQSSFLTALQLISIAMCTITSSNLTQSWTRMSHNFVRRYKWLFYPDYEDLPPALPLPDLTQCIPQITEVIRDTSYSASSDLRLARDILRRLGERSPATSLEHEWKDERRRFLGGLADICDRLRKVPRGPEGYDNTLLKWDPNICPWLSDLAV